MTEVRLIAAWLAMIFARTHDVACVRVRFCSKRHSLQTGWVSSREARRLGFVVVLPHRKATVKETQDA